MTGIRILLIGMVLSLLFSSCGATKKTKSTQVSPKTSRTDAKSIPVKNSTETKITPMVSSSNKKDLTTIDYIDIFSDIAVNQMRIHHIPASITLAQGILESRSGNSDLTRVSNNHFGIKCHKEWKGARTYYDDDKKGECFRVYEYATNSYNDHSRFLRDRQRYSNLFKLNERDYKGWAKGLQKAGYATDRSYPQKLISIIEKYELYKYDEVVLGKRVSKIVTSSKVNSALASTSENPLIYIVKKGDGLYGISRRFNLEIEELKSINNLDSNTIYPGQQLSLKSVDDQTNQNKPVDIQVNEVLTNNKKIEKVVPKVSIDTIPPSIKTEPLKQMIKDQQLTKTPTFHIVQKGETLYQLAYKYDLAIPEFRRWNGISKDEIKIGQRLFIQEPNKNFKPSANQKTHRVSKGETLYFISKKYGLSVPELRILNNLNDNTISIGQVLLIK